LEQVKNLKPKKMTARHNSLINKEEKSLQTTNSPRINNSLITFLVVLIALFFSFPVMADQPNVDQFTSISFFDAFADDDIVNVTIETNITDLIENRKRDEYLPATMKWQDASGIWKTFDVGIEPRGKFRRRICDFPPLRVKFSKDELKASGFAHYNKLKLVTHCMDDKNEGNSNLLKEYLAYKLYNELNINSFRVQLIKITYIDNVGDYGKETRYGFIIESKKEMADRLGGKICDECFNPGIDDLSKKDMNVAAVFQYMIGNADWDIEMNKNIALVKTSNSNNLITVPYDFDFAGLVNTSYAIPNPNYGIKSVKERVFLGKELDNNQMRNTLKYFVNKKSDLFRVVKKMKPLNYTDKQETYTYLNEFYENVSILLNLEDENIYEILKNAHLSDEQSVSSKSLGK
jgi:hypothetical protein